MQNTFGWNLLQRLDGVLWVKSSEFTRLSFVDRAINILKGGWHHLTHCDGTTVWMLSMFRSGCLFCLHKDTSLVSYLDNGHCVLGVKSNNKLHIPRCLQRNVKIHSTCSTRECVYFVFFLNFFWYLFYYKIEPTILS